MTARRAASAAAEPSTSDALVVFGATGDLAHKQIFPSLQALVRSGRLDMPIVGVAKSGWSQEQFADPRAGQPARTTAADSTKPPSPSWSRQLPLRRRRLPGSGDVSSPAPRRSATRAQPLHYLAIPPSLFATVVAAAWPTPGCAEAPAWSSRSPSAATSPRRGPSTGRCIGIFPESRDLSDRSLPRQRSRCRTCSTSASPTRFLEPIWNRDHVDSVQITMAEEFRRRRAAAAFYEEAGAIRDVVQNHLLQVTALVCHGTRRPVASPSRCATRSCRLLQGDPAARARGRGARPIHGATAGSRAWRPTRASRRSRRCDCTSTPGAGRACRSTSAPASVCR